MKKIISRCAAVLLFSLIFGSALISCDEKNNQTKKSNVQTSSSYDLTVGFSIDTLAIERWQRDLDVFVNRVKELGANIIVQNAGSSVEEQNRQLMYLMERNVDVIVCLPKDADGLAESIQKIKSKGIPVISYDRLIRGCDVDLYMTVDSERVGELMAEQMQRITKSMNWYCILGDQKDYNMTMIEQGMNNVLSNTYIRINHTFYTSGWNYDLAYDEAVNLITSGRIPGAIICGNDAVADAVIKAFSTYYPDHHIPICGQDAEIAACQSIVSGKQDFTIYKPITKLAEYAAEYAVRMAKGSKSEELSQGLKTIDNGYKMVPVYLLQPELVTIENIDRVIIDSGFHTFNEVYGAKSE